MAQNQETDNAWQGNKEMNIQENSSVTDDAAENDDKQSSWRAGDGEGEMKKPTENPTGAAGQSPAEETETDNPGQNP